MENDQDENVKQIQVDITDPKNIDRQRVENFFDVYANRITISVTQHDVVLGFEQQGPLINDKINVIERGQVTISHSQAMQLNTVLSKVLIKSQTPDSPLT